MRAGALCGQEPYAKFNDCLSVMKREECLACEKARLREFCYNDVSES